MTTIEVTSHVEPIKSCLQCESMEEEITVSSYILSVSSSINTIEHKVTDSNEQTLEVNSHINKLRSSVSTIHRAIVVVGAGIQPVTVVTDIIVPTGIETPIYALVYVVENGARVNQFHNMTNTYQQENRTETQVI